jgi:hypothetical protein
MVDSLIGENLTHHVLVRRVTPERAVTQQGQGGVPPLLHLCKKSHIQSSTRVRSTRE